MNCILLYGSNLMPLQKHGGVFRIASELRKHNYSTLCIDMCAFEHINKIDQLKEVLSNVVGNETLWVGFSTTFFDKLFGLTIKSTNDNDVHEFIQFIKTLNPKIKIISGGTRQFPLQQYGVKIFKSYSDKEIIEFTNWCLTNNKSKLEYHTSLINGSEFKDFATSKIEYTSADLIHKLDGLPIEISRGCIFKCKFCAFPLNGKTKGDWIKQGQVLLDEFNRNYEMLGVTHYTFTDDTYNDSVDKLKYLHDTVFSKLKFKISYSSYLRLDLLMRFPESVSYLKSSGLTSAMFGIETINHQSAKSIGKGLNPYTQLEYVKALKQGEFKDTLITSGFILGLPHDTVDTFKEFEDFLFSDKNYLDSWYINALGISPPENSKNSFYSEFDLNYTQYGYEMTNEGWCNNNTGLTYKQCQTIANDITEKSKKHSSFKFGGFSFNYVRRFGIPDDELMNLSRKEIVSKYNINTLMIRECESYVNDMIKLSHDIKRTCI